MGTIPPVLRTNLMGPGLHRENGHTTFLPEPKSSASQLAVRLPENSSSRSLTRTSKVTEMLQSQLPRAIWPSYLGEESRGGSWGLEESSSRWWLATKLLFVLFRDGSTSMDGSQNLKCQLIRFADFTVLQDTRLPSLKAHTLKWIGISSHGVRPEHAR